MPDTPQNATTLRVRLNHHAAMKAAAETERARVIADRAEAGALLSDADLDAVDREVARLSDVVERAGSRVELIRPALAAAQAREADAEARRSAAAGSAAFADVRRGMLEALAGAPAKAKSAAQAALMASAPVAEYSPKLFDEKPAPRVDYGDVEAWHEAREARLRAEGSPSEAQRR